MAVPGALLGLADTMQVRQVQELDVRAGAADAGTFEGYACVWDQVDTYGTSFRRGSFAAGGLDSDPYALLWMHTPADPIGTFTAIEDEHGLLIKGGWDDTVSGRDARARAKSGSAPGLSVGFVPLMVDPDDDTVFTQVRLVETSQITRRMASVPGAQLTAARKRAARTAPEELAERADAAQALLALAVAGEPA